MQNLEKSIKKSFSRNLSGFKKTPSCPSELDLGRYLEGVLALNQKDKIERHLADCGYCLDLVIVAKNLLRESAKKPAITQILSQQKWFILSMLSFLLSFFIKRYFFQFLTLSLILGVKWGLSAEGSRNLVMIFRSLSLKEAEDKEKVLERR